ncbi:MAG TPA: FAD-dependent oxidoreductase, partial [Verrucomicrobiae bacterium]|nr:FAD-dependent oxidoreductase [Verrucomicrobiae bacterium]
MSRDVYDTLIIGGGPGGSAAATFLARAGKRVLVLEKEHFPRCHIGESLLPYNQEIFEEMGVLPTLEAAGFT